MQTSQPLCRGSAWIMENFIQVYNEEYWSHMHGYTQVPPPVDVILLAPLQRLCA